MERFTKHKPTVAETPRDSVMAQTMVWHPPILLAPDAGLWRVIEVVSRCDVERE